MVRETATISVTTVNGITNTIITVPNVRVMVARVAAKTKNEV